MILKDTLDGLHEHLIENEKITNKNYIDLQFSCCESLIQIIGAILVIYIYGAFVNEPQPPYLAIIFYISYLVFIFLCPTFQYLINIGKHVSIKDFMKKMFSSSPKISLEVECFHYGYKGQKDTTVKEIIEFPYYSFKDVSGLFKLNCDEAKSQKVSLIMLYITTEIKMADAISISDLENKITEIFNKYKDVDDHITITNIRTIEGFEERSIVSLDDSMPFGINIYIYCIFVILGISLAYSIYLKSCCITQNFTIRKLVSTRYNLLSEEKEKEYQNLTPSLKLKKETIYLFKQHFGKIIKENQVDLPTLEEIQRAEKYDNFIPRYVTDEAGVVQNLYNNGVDSNMLNSEKNQIDNIIKID